jgi:chemotaxis family two-component system response regulator Rcp1
MDAAVERLILVIDANPDHIQVIETTFRQSRPLYTIHAIANGADALEFLQRSPSAGHGGKRPDLILLDLDLADTDGLDLLSAIKADNHLRRIPIIIFTLTDHPNRVFHSYKLHSNCYVLKSDDWHNLATIVKRIEEFWLGIVTLPVE